MENKLQRKLGVNSLVCYYFSTIVGVGIFIVPIATAKIAGPASFISWLIVLLIAYPFAMIFASIAQDFPVSNSIPKFIESVTVPFFAKSISLFLLVTSVMSNPLLGIASAKHIQSLFGFEANHHIYLVALLMMSLSSLFNLIGITISSKIQIVCLIILIITVAITVVSSVPYFNFENLTPFAPHGYEAIGLAVTVCFFSIVGWENVSAISEEVKTPEKTYKKAILLSILLIGIFYISLVVTVLIVIPNSYFNNNITILSSLLTICCSSKFGFIGDLISILLLFLTTNAWVLGSSRLMFALSRDGILPSFMVRINAKNNIPTNAILFQWGIFVLILTLMMVFNLSDEYLLSVSSLNYMLVYAVVFGCGIKFFKDKKIKLLSLFSFLITAIFLPQNINGLIVSFLIVTICGIYILIKYSSKNIVKSRREISVTHI